MEIRLVFGELGDAGPGALGGGAHQAEDLLELVFVGRAGEQGATRVHFGHDTAGGPDVDAGVVGATPEQDVRGAVPEGNDFVGEGVDGNAEGAGETKVGEFELAFVVDEEILGFQVTVEDAIFMTECNSLEELVHERFDCDVVELAPVPAGVHVLFEVFVHIFKYKHQFVFRVDDIVERDDIFVFELFHQ